MKTFYQYLILSIVCTIFFYYYNMFMPKGILYFIVSLFVVFTLNYILSKLFELKKDDKNT